MVFQILQAALLGVLMATYFKLFEERYNRASLAVRILGYGVVMFAGVCLVETLTATLVATFGSTFFVACLAGMGVVRAWFPETLGHLGDTGRHARAEALSREPLAPALRSAVRRR